MLEVLIIEDDTVISGLYKTRLEMEGFSVAVASDGEAGFNIIKNRHPDVVLLDIMIPKKSGLEIMKEVSSDKSLGKIKFIAMSNLDDKDVRLQLKNLGVLNYIIKADHKPAEVVALIKSLDL